MDNRLRSKLEEKKISDNYCINTYINYNESHFILELNYMNGKFIAEKMFSNDYKGIEAMEETMDLYRSENDIKKYFEII